MSDLPSYRAVRGNRTGNGELPPTTGTPAAACDLRDYWVAPDRIYSAGATNLRPILYRALQALARHEGWQRVRSAQAPRSQRTRRATA